MYRITRHYVDLLAEHYSWMCGSPLAEKVAEQQSLLVELGLPAHSRDLAIDLGCGPGYQALALANLGYESVLAIDTSPHLLGELTAAMGERPIKPILFDLIAFSDFVRPGSAGAIVCMGDTLPHLEGRALVSRLFRDAHEALEKGGRLVLTFRDLSVELTGLERFLPVRADKDRVMVCMLEYGPETVLVNDLIHVRDGDEWNMHKGSYTKLRLSPDHIVDELKNIGFDIGYHGPAGRMHAISAVKV